MPQLKSRLLLVTDRHRTGSRPLLSVLKQALRAGSPSVQLRERDLCTRDLLELALAVQVLTEQCGSQLVINDRADLALMMENVGVHLRSNSLPVPVARDLIGPNRLLGISTHSFEEAARAESDGADYVVLGPIYPTASKQSFGPPLGLRVLEDACRAVRIPVLAIGGITPARGTEIRHAGAFGAAVITAILSVTDVEDATHEMLTALA